MASTDFGSGSFDDIDGIMDRLKDLLDGGSSGSSDPDE